MRTPPGSTSKAKAIEWEAGAGFWYGILSRFIPGEPRLIGQVQIKNVDWEVSRADAKVAGRRDVGVPHEARDPKPFPNTIFPPERQPGEPAAPMHGRPNKRMPPVFGTSTPLRGLSGAVRRMAYTALLGLAIRAVWR